MPGDRHDGGIDLHSHSLASDGQYPAAEVAALAAAAGLRVWALCDHDTVAGLGEGATAASRLGMRFVTGIEVSCFVGPDDHKEIHLLGHFLDPEHARLKAFEDMLAAERRVRMEKIVKLLASCGVVIRVEDIEKTSGGKTIGRPHVARAIVETGAVSSVKEAFDRWLGEGKPAYVQRHRLLAKDAVKLVRDAGGTATIAHPGVSRLDKMEITRLREAGVDGIEVRHVDHVPSLREKLLRLAEELQMVPTAGSDYHGPAVSPDRHFGDVTMDEEDLARLEARRP
jgi:predicted metal-dependent phosphoesterase TrpH